MRVWFPSKVANSGGHILSEKSELCENTDRTSQQTVSILSLVCAACSLAIALADIHLQTGTGSHFPTFA